MPANGRWDLIRRLKVKEYSQVRCMAGCEYVCDHRSLVKPTRFCPVSGVGVRDV